MRDTTSLWSFQRFKSRPVLKDYEVDRWKAILKKILKVGMEFEFNLPEKQTGFCKGESLACPCINLTEENDCWKQCINKENG